MSLLGYVLLLTAVLCCFSAPAPDGLCSRPPRMIEAELLGDWDDESYPTGQRANYQCRPGFSPLGSIMMVCIYGKWENLAPEGQCRRLSCGHPGNIPFGSFRLMNDDSFIFGAIVEYTCDVGYWMVSEEATRQCTATGWSNYPPRCEVTSCKPPPPVTNATIDGQVKARYKSGEKVTYLCDLGYILGNSLTGEVLCENTHWTELPVCKIGKICDPPPAVQFGDTTKFTKTNYTSGESVEYRCKHYYILNGNGTVRCLNGTWDEAPVCLEPCTIRTLDMEEHNIQLKGRNEEKLYIKHGDNIELQCKSGYKAPPDTQMRIVCEHGKLEYPKCFKTDRCQKPEPIDGAQLQGEWNDETYPPGKIANFACRPGYTQDGSIKVACIEGTWFPIAKGRCEAESLV